MREERNVRPKVTFVRKLRFSGIVGDKPGEWDLEFAVGGTPNPMSGMILNLIDIDQILDAQLTASSVPNLGVVVSDVPTWLQAFEKNVSEQIKRLTLSSEPVAERSAADDAAFVSVALDDGESRHLRTTRRS